MSDRDRSQDEPVSYTIRLREIASRDLNSAVVYLARTASEAIAVEWRIGLRAEIGTLATLPRRCSLAPERFHIEVRRLLYRRPKSKVAHWIYFTIEGEASDAPEAPTVAILHIRHAASKPLTRTEIRRIETVE